MFSCKDISEKASDHIDGHLRFGDRIKMHLHLLICHHCRRYLRQFRATVALSRQLSPSPIEQAEVESRARLLLDLRNKRN